MITFSKKQEIKCLINNLLKKHAVLSPPVFLDKILESENISYIERNLNEFGLDESVDAFIYKEGDTKLLAVNPFTHLYSEKKRFSIAHELGHFFLHIGNKSTYVATRNGENSNLQEEEEANFFAANLLMPDEMIERVYFSLEIPSLSKMANIFEVSMAAMKIKLENMGLWYCS